MKKIFFIFFVLVIVLLIFCLTKDNKTYYLILADDDNNKIISNEIIKYFKENNEYERSFNYLNNNYRTTDLLNDIKNNSIITENVTIRNALIKADLINIFIGRNDYINYIDDINLLKNNIDNLKLDMESLFKELRKISKEKIIAIGIYNPMPENKELNDVLKELNEMYSNVANEYNIYYIDVYDQINDFILEKKLTKLGYKYISEKLINEIDNGIIN